VSCPAWIDAKFRVHVLLWAALSALAYGLVAAIIPNPVFGRQIPPESFAIAVWLLSAPLMGIIGATYSSPWAPATTPLVILGREGASTGAASAAVRDDDRATWLGGVASFGAFLAIGCPVCNKLALLLLGTSGALSIWAPIQPILGAASLLLLAATAAWRLRLRATGATCTV
jgi:hypothetical protein